MLFPRGQGQTQKHLGVEKMHVFQLYALEVSQSNVLMDMRIFVLPDLPPVGERVKSSFESRLSWALESRHNRNSKFKKDILMPLPFFTHTHTRKDHCDRPWVRGSHWTNRFLTKTTLLSVREVLGSNFESVKSACHRYNVSSELCCPCAKPR